MTKLDIWDQLYNEMVKLMKMLIIEFKLGGVSGGKLLKFFVIRKYLISLKGSFIKLL